MHKAHTYARVYVRARVCACVCLRNQYATITRKDHVNLHFTRLDEQIVRQVFIGFSYDYTHQAHPATCRKTGVRAAMQAHMCLQVKAFWMALLLLEHGLLLGFAEITLHDLHAPLAES